MTNPWRLGLLAAIDPIADPRAKVADWLAGHDGVKFYTPNGTTLQNFTGFLKGNDTQDPTTFELSMHDRWVHLHPAAIALTACAAALVNSKGGTFTGEVIGVPSLNYLIRTGLFKYINLPVPVEIQEHEEAGRFIPITQIRNNEALKDAIANLVPLLHAPPEVADPIKYVFSEMVRNVLEHSSSPVGAFVTAQYYQESKRIAIGIADAGIGVFGHMSRHHTVKTDVEAITLALQPGISGTTPRIGGTSFNAGAGLFFTKSIAAFSQNMFLLYSGSAAYRLMRGKGGQASLNPNPLNDHHKFATGLPHWPGTLVGIDINVQQGAAFADLLDQIRHAYRLDVKNRRDYTAKIRFS
ncbi:MAG TPA: hypothetical protein VH019_09120 [Rhizomicrobium sp.]|jgi:anti-sigma regulatory factor (Ser/Thr protein kinase)|nr:hypothetical protein [Rhizomicrobium sp.]